MRDTADFLDDLRTMPGGSHLREVLDLHPEALLVGGAVRDLLLGVVPTELDIVVTGDSRTVAERLGVITSAHERFGTFHVDVQGTPCDVATARSESYSEPGALPDVTPASLDEDLLRRDFTVNAIAFSPAAGVISAPRALDDLTGRRLRILHERSFIDDPTRLWRLVRYAVRLGFLPAARTEQLAREAVDAAALATVSADRRTAELRLLLGEDRALDALHAAQNLGLVCDLKIDPEVTGRAQRLVDGFGSVAMTVLASCITSPGWGHEFALDAHERRILDRSASLAPIDPISPGRVSDLAALLDAEPAEAVAVAGARGDAATAHRWLAEWRDVALAISGQDLIAAGLAEGPEVGHLLSATRAAVLDGRVLPGRASELAFALGETDGAHEDAE